MSERGGRRDSRRGWGWHRLADSWARRIVADSSVGPGELVVDLGAGEGALVGPLLATGARVIAVELHDRRAGLLKSRWPDEVAARRLVVVRVDATELHLPRQPFQVVANPPWAVASPLLQLLLSRGSHLSSAHLVLPKVVAQRFVRGEAPGAGRWLLEYDLRLGMSLPRNAFQPPPRVDSALLVVRRRNRAPRRSVRR